MLGIKDKFGSAIFHGDLVISEDSSGHPQTILAIRDDPELMVMVDLIFNTNKPGVQGVWMNKEEFLKSKWVKYNRTLRQDKEKFLRM